MDYFAQFAGIYVFKQLVEWLVAHDLTLTLVFGSRLPVMLMIYSNYSSIGYRFIDKLTIA